MIGRTIVLVALTGMMLVTFEAAIGGCAIGFRLTALGGPLT
jgi:hypothetical protein